MRDISAIFFLLISTHFLLFTLSRTIHPKNVINRIGSVMVSVLASSAVDRGFEPRSGQANDY
jgi:hypothetical protein